MHTEVRDFVSRFATDNAVMVVEIGSRHVNLDINWSIRDLFPNAAWTGLDLYPGKLVDIVCDAEHWRPPEPVDLVICCEVLEHARRWRGLIAAAAQMLKPGGRLIVTCAAPGRSPHSAIDGGPLRRREYYRNLGAAAVSSILQESGFDIEQLEEVNGDLRACARLKARAGLETGISSTLAE